MKNTQHLIEGGNVFKSADGSELTQRINKADVIPTVAWLEKITGLPLLDNMLGTTGKNPTSGDLDLAVDEKTTNKDTVYNALINWCKTNNLDPRSYVRKSGVNVHFRTPILGDASNGFVQTDFMLGDPEWQKFAMQGGAANSTFRGSHKHVLLASVAKAYGFKWSFNQGLVSRASNNVVTKDPDEIARYLLGPNANRNDLNTVESILAKIKGQPNYAELTADARETFGKEGLTLPESIQEGTATWFRSITTLLGKQ